ncbi:MAG: DUF4347 domain-containing protein, partial [Methylococcaceae bacterium]
MNTNKLISTIFIDARVANLAELLPGLEASTQVITVNTEQDGLSQIATALTGRKDIDAVHILSHGSSGQLHLGRDKIDAKTLRDHADALATIRATLADNAELLVYGCHVAKNDAGQEFISLLSEMIGAEVAASIDATGSEDLGGNWQLTARTGAIKTTPLRIEGWHGLLAVNLPPSITSVSANGLEDAVSIEIKLSGTDVDGTVASVIITRLPTAEQGTLYYSDGTPAVFRQYVSPTLTNSLIFKPAANFYGTVLIPFAVKDNNGALSSVINATIKVTSVNDAPLGTDKIQPLLINSAGYTVTTTDFGFTDPVDSSANKLSNVIITAIPATTDGVYVLNGKPILGVARPLTISIADISSNKLTFVPERGKSGVSIGALSFKVQDNGGTLNGGVDTATAANSLSFTIAALPVASIAVSAPVAEDGAANLVYTVSLDKASNTDTVITLNAPAGSATAGTDYSGNVPS